MHAFSIPNSKETVKFAEAVLSTLRGHRQTDGRTEAGGQLFATFEGQSVVVTHATEPAAADFRSPFRFVANRWRERTHIKRLYASGLHYVGDWHTHPQFVPVPSPTDIASINDCYRKSKKEIGAFLLVVVGTSEFPDGLFVGLTDGISFRALPLARAS
jgi:integrative and conjugative element protein (TIGR02256 family)